MANTIVKSRQAVTLSAIDSDWSLLESFPGRHVFYIAGIQFFAAGVDTLILRDGSITGPVIFKYTSTAAHNINLAYLGLPCVPYYDFSECTISGATTSFTVCFR